MSGIFLNSYAFRFVTRNKRIINEFSINIRDSIMFNMGSNMDDFNHWLYQFSFEITYVLSRMQSKAHVKYFSRRIRIDGLDIFCNIDVRIGNSNQAVPTCMKIGEIKPDKRLVYHLYPGENEYLFAECVRDQLAEYERGLRDEILINVPSFCSSWEFSNTELDFWRQNGIIWH